MIPQCYLPQLIYMIRDVLGPDVPVSTDLPPGQTAWVAIPVFGLAKQQGKPVSEVAAAIKEKLQTSTFHGGFEWEEITVSGGFVNLTPKFVTQYLPEATSYQYGTQHTGEGKTVVIDYSQPNIAKRMSVGHLRSTIIGDSLRALYESQGYRVIGINYLGDWGTQYGKLVVAYKEKYGDLEPRDTVTIQELFELYVQYHADEVTGTDQDAEARAQFKLLEQRDPAVTKLWQFFIDLSLVEYQKIYDRLKVSFTEPKMGESFHRESFDEVINFVQSSGLSKESNGAQIVEIPNLSAPMMLRKSDGATTYGSRDLAALKYRAETYTPEAILYVVSNEQTFHFQQVFAVARMTGLIPESITLEHVKFGFMQLPEGKMSTRHGRVVFLEDVLDEAVKRARAVIEQKNSDLAEATKQHVAEVVGIGALKYFDLSHDRNHDIVFDWDRMLQLTGDSAPYLQYSYVRASRILKKAEELLGADPYWFGKLEGNPGVAQRENGYTVGDDIASLCRTVARYPLVVERAAEQYAPHIIATYLNELATAFNRFYETHPVLQAEGVERDLGITIVGSVANTLKLGLNLLGIDVVEEM